MLPRFTIFLILIVFFIGSTSFGLTLQESVEIALENNPEILAQAERINALGSEIGQVYSAFLPELKIEGRFGREYQSSISYEILPGQTFVVTPDNAANVKDYRAVLTQNLYTGGKLESRLDIARVRLKIAKEELRRKKRELVYRVALAYYSVLRAERLLDLSLESADVAAAHLAQAKAYVALGTAPKADLLRAQVKAAEVELGKIQAESELEIARIEFNDVLGREAEEPLILKDAKSRASEDVLPSSEELLFPAFEHRPEWKVLNLQRVIGEREIIFARSGFSPTLSLRGTISRSYLDYPPGELQIEESTGILESDTWNVYGLVSWTIFDGLKTPNKIREAEANLAEIKAHERRIENRIVADVKRARLYFCAAKLRIKSAQKGVEYAGQNLMLAQEKYRKGVRGNIEFIEAQTSLTKAKTDLLNAEADYELTKAKINLAVGQEVFALF
ncbi:MAG: TolC family protein [Candidatus Margulisiibacteriota bacterium]